MVTWQRITLALLLIANLACPTLAQDAAPKADEPAAKQPPAAEWVPAEIRLLMQDRKYAEAIEAIEVLEKRLAAKKQSTAYLGYLKGRALYLNEKYDEAVKVFEAVSKADPTGPWARRARFAKGLSLTRKVDFRAAELLYKAEAEYLLSLDRKQEIADIYLEFAEAYFKPAQEERKPDYSKALEFYRQALRIGPQPDKRIDIELLVATCQQKLDQHDEASKRYQQFIKDHTDSPLVVEARFRLGESQLAGGKGVEARRSWQDLLALHKDSKSLRLPEAAYKLSLTYGIPQPGDDEDLALGVAALRTFLAKYPEHKLAAQAHLRIAQAYLSRGRYEDAVAALKTFLADDRYADREQTPEARFLLGRSYKLQKKFDDALAVWREYLAKHPTGQAWSQAQREIIDTEFAKAAEHYAKKKYDEARKLWGEFLVKYPLDARNRQIMYQFGQMLFAEEKWEDAIGQWRRLVSKYPDTNESSRAQFVIAITLEQKLGKLDDALKEYRKVTWGNYQSQAQAKIAQLTTKEMKIATERVFRSDETPQLTLTTRNIESVTVRIYKVDLETYFRKMHLARGVEGLDIALIDPDKTFEFPVPEYQEHQRLESEIPVPLPAGKNEQVAKSGVMAVTVSSKTYEATTLVLQSDLDVIVKSSRDEVFVFAENMLTGRPWPGVRVLVSDGKEIFAEGQTGDDGVLHEALDELESAEDVRVFAVTDGHTASNMIGLSGVGVAEGLTTRGYIYTDRPAYRAGQLVHVRGVIRQVSGDTYTVAEGKKYQVDVYDNRNRQVSHDQVELGAFGSFHTRLMLPSAAPQGTYRIVVHDEQDKENFQGTFLVHAYQLEPVQIEVDTERTVYYRGEQIEGTIRVSFYYGAPVAGREVRFQLAGDRMHTATTDAKGEVAFTLPTRQYREAQQLNLVVSLPERNLRTGRSFFLATQGFNIHLSTLRSLFLAGETFGLGITTADAEGEPLSTELTLSVMRKTKVGRQVGETLIEKHDVKTDEEGAAGLTLKLAEGGNYTLRAEGTDRFGNPVWAEHTLNVSDDDDRVRLRIIANNHTLHVGDVAQVDLHWRQDPALALLTFQGARILDYRLVELKRGSNKLKLPMTAKLAQNFDLAVSVMIDPRPEKPAAAVKPGEAAKPPRRFHFNTSSFTVLRHLSVDLALKPTGDANAKQPRPGEKVEVTVTTTDAQGRPVAAEVSLAMVEQALLKRFGPQIDPIDAFFRGETRQSAVRTTSSITFEYRPKTQPINARLLAEEDRLAVLEEEGRRLEELNEGDVQRPFVTSVIPVENGEGPPTEGIPLDSLFGDVEGELDQERDADGAVGWSDSAGGNSQSLSGTLFNGQASFGFGGGGGGMGFAQQGGQAADPFGGEEEIQTNGSGQVLLNAGTALAFHDRRVQTATTDDAGNLSLAINGTDATTFGELPEKHQAAVQHYFSRLATGNVNEIQVVAGDGTFWNLNIAGTIDVQTWDEAKADELVTALNQQGAVLLANLAPHETGYWNPQIATDEKGTATVTVTLPERSTGWQLTAKGITADTLAGEKSQKLVVKKDLFGQLKLPAAFTDGDVAQVHVSVHNDLVDEGKIVVTLKTTIGEKSVTEKKLLDVKAKGIQELVFTSKMALPPKASAAGVGNVTAVFELTVAAPDGKRRDVVRRSVPLRPYGMPVFAMAGGTSRSDTTAFVEPPAGMTLAAPSLQVILGPTVERSLLDVLFAPAPWCQIENGRIASGTDTAVSDLMAAIALQKLVGASREAGSPQAESLDARVRSSISLLVSMQQDDGGWSWTGLAAGSDRYITARAVWALTLARRAGYRVAEDRLGAAENFVRTQLAKARVTDYETKATLLHALAAAGRGDFTLANQLYRNRNTLSNAALVHLTLALVEMDRKQTAGELLALLATRNFKEAKPKRLAASSSLPLCHTETELRALYGLALAKATEKAADIKLKEQADWLMGHRTGHRWAPEKATGPAMLALCDYFARSRSEAGKYRLTIIVNDLKAKEIAIDADSPTHTFDVPADFLAPKGRQTVRFELTGRGEFTYQCVLSGFVPADKLKSTTTDWQVQRYYQPAPLELDGREIPRGFDGLKGSYKTFRNDLTQLPVARRAHVELRVQRDNVPSNTPQEHLEYLVVTEPLPAGTTVVEKSIRGGFERFEISPGAITFYVGSQRHVGSIHYELHGYLPGEYRTAPTLVRDAYAADRIAVAKPKPLTVLALGKKSQDKYRLTPRELFELGKRHYEKKALDQAAKYLSDLLANWNVADQYYKESARMLLDAHLQTGPAGEVVRYFEIVLEKFPELEIPADKLMKIGDAYHQVGEYERSYLVFRAVVEGRFLLESQVAGFLQGQDEFTRSVDVMSALLREYPPEPYVASATYALAQRVYAKAPEAAADEKLREQKITRIDLVRSALDMLDDFLTAFPDDPSADEASFSLAGGLLDLKAYQQAIDACRRFTERYPKSGYLHDYWYIIGYCHYALGQHREALEMCRKVSEAKRRNPETGRQDESKNKWRAIYILGQIYHSLGKAADAIGQYERVKDRFVDARQAIDYFVRKEIALPEVSTLKPGEKVNIELSFRNVAACDVKVYKIDLMKFSLLKRDLAGITKINLAGIRPYHEAEVKLGDGKDYRDRTTPLALPLADQGAYLVVCRGENLHASGLVLVSPLALDVQEEVDSGRVRATVRNALESKYVPDVHVKVIGSQNSDFTSGESDLRGIFIADGIVGTSTVIAQAGDGRYAFYRGETPLGGAEAPQSQTNAAEPAAPADASDLLEDIKGGNQKIQAKQQDQLQELYDNPNTGGFGGGMGGFGF